MTLLRSLLLSFPLFAACLLFAPDARAATTCTATMTALTFGTTDTSGNTNATATLEYRCETSVAISLINAATVRLCFAIGAGSQSGSTVASRLMRNAESDPLQFQMYRNSAYTQVWGNSLSVDTVDTTLTYPLNSIIGLLATGSGSGSVTLHGRVPAQTATAAGMFTTTFGADSTSVVYRYRDTLLTGTPSSCTSGGAVGATQTFPFTASAMVPHHCDISTATDLAFGAVPGLIGSPQDQTSSISMTCTRRTAWNVALDNGQNAVGNTRRMRLGATGQYVTYELYRNPGPTDRWGSTIGTDTRSGTAADPTQNLTVYGRVPAPQSVPAGNYSDVVTVTVTY